MNKYKVFGLVFFMTLVAITNCLSQSIKKNPTYFKTPSKVGLLVIVNPIECDKVSHASGFGAIGGALSAALSSPHKKEHSKYDSAFAVIEPQIDPSQKAKTFYSDIYTSKGKQIVLVEPISSDKLVKFIEPKDGNKKYFKQDLRFLHDQYQIDEVLIVDFHYGVRAGYSYGIENSRLGMTSIDSKIINLSDNSIVIKESTDALERIHGGWKTPPAYENLKNAIAKAIEDALTREKEKYNKPVSQ
jgi:hypothetical protein